jgi:hypothetical protein
VRKHEVALLKGDVRPLSDRRLWKPALMALAALMMQGETLVDFRVAIHRTEAERENWAKSLRRKSSLSAIF